MLKLSSILLGSENPKRLSDFYGRVLGKGPDMEDGGYYGFMAGDCFLGVGPHDKVKGRNPAPERILLNLETADVKGEFERIKGLGTKVVADPYRMGEGEMWIATFADPDGNYFQLMSPWEPEPAG